MSEELLKTIVKLFAIVAKERITDQERNNMREFLSVHLNQSAIVFYMNLFDEFVHEFENTSVRSSSLRLDSETLEFLDEWSSIIKISKEVNRALTLTQKLVMMVKIIELIYSGDEISERQNNLIFYIGEALKIRRKTVNSITGFVKGSDCESLSSTNTLIIEEGSGKLKLKGPHLIAKNLTGLIAVLRIPESETYFIKYLGISVLYMNGIPLKSRKIDVFPTGSTIRGNKIQTIYYSDVVSKFIIQQEKTPVTFTAEHVFYHFKSGRAGLQNVNVAEKGGKLIGVMGSSGSGKSTLMNVLNGSEIPSSGSVKVNGVDIHVEPKCVEGLMGYVPQDDFLIADLTVYENLFFAAELCFKDNSKEDNDALVKKLLGNIGLSETAHLKVGSPMEKTISGGQRKRLNIALELMREPAILFVDEPTSGLSSRDSENIMDMLKELSFRGKMIFVVIHQPSSDIFRMFDSLIILDTGGFQIYYGNPVEAVTYFKELVHAANRRQGACHECGNINPEQVFNIIETKVVNEFGRLTPMRKVSPGQWYQYFREYIELPKINHINERLKAFHKIPNPVSQLKTYFIRDVKSKLANKQYILINFLEAPLLALFIAYMTRYIDSDAGATGNYSFYNNSNIPIYFFMSIIVALFMGLTVSAEEIFRDRMILKREKFLNLSRMSYLFSKIFVLLLISAIQTFSFVIIGDLVLEIKGMEPRLWLILFSVSAFANMLGLNISSTFNSAVTIYILIPLLLIPQLLLSGVVISFDKFNPSVTHQEYVPVFGDVMTSRWAFEAAMVTQFKDNPYQKLFYGNDVIMSESSYKKHYFLPEIETELQHCLSKMNNSSANEEFRQSLNLVSSEMKSEFDKFNRDYPDWLLKMLRNQFDSSVYFDAIRDLELIESVYQNRFTKSWYEKDEKILQMEAGGVRMDSLIRLYTNSEVKKFVLGQMSPTRIINTGEKLIRKVEPIYIVADEEMGMSYRSPLYAPEKAPLGYKIDTFYFNLMVIWGMSLVLFVTLYFDALKHFLYLFISDKRRRRQQKP